MDKIPKLKLVILIALSFSAVFLVYLSLREDRNGRLTVAFLNIGQGDAIFIEAPSGNQVLIDGGPDRSILRELSKVMPFYDKSIDVVVASHADQDHVGGLPDVLRRYDVEVFMEPGVPGESSSYAELEKIVNSSNNGNIKKIPARRGMIIDLGAGAVLQILFPDRDPAGMETNMSSIVARLVYGENEFMLTGDSPQAIENYLIMLGGLQSDVLKVGHHGSKTSSSQSFIAAIAPKYAVISAGRDNKYGHPNQEVLDNLSNFGVQILRTDQIGRIIFKSNGIDLEVK